MLVLRLKCLALGLYIETKIADNIAADKDCLHQHSPRRACENIVHNPQTGPDQHQLPEQFVLFAKGGNRAENATGSAENGQQPLIGEDRDKNCGENKQPHQFFRGGKNTGCKAGRCNYTKEGCRPVAEQHKMGGDQRA